MAAARSWVTWAPWTFRELLPFQATVPCIPEAAYWAQQVPQLSSPWGPVPWVLGGKRLQVGVPHIHLLQP